MWTGKTINSDKSDVQITAFDLDLDGSLNAGTEAISSQSIGLGVSLDMEISDAELGRLACEDGLSGVVGTVTLVATRQDTTITFKSGASIRESYSRQWEVSCCLRV